MSDGAAIGPHGLKLPVDNLGLLHVTKCTTVVASALSVLEIASTFPDEVAYIWPNHWSIMKVIFFINKYSVLVDTSLATVSVLYTEDARQCEIQFQALAYTYICGTLVSEIILLSRTLAIWNYHLYVKILIGGGLVELLPVAIYSVYQAINNVEYPPNEILHIMGCVPGTQDHDAWPAYACFILAETTIVALTIIRRVTCDSDLVRSSQGQLLHTIYRDGTFFYIVVLAVSTMNLLMMLLAPPELISSLQMPLRVVHSALCTRVLLNLRKAAAADSSGGRITGADDLTRHTTLAFAPGGQNTVSSSDSEGLSSRDLGECSYNEV